MATYGSYPGNTLSSIDSHLVCDVCGSADIVDTKEGYVCRACGIELEIKKLTYHRRYLEEQVQYAKPQGPTQIGSKRERCISFDSVKLNRLNRQNSIVPKEKVVVEKARVEINKIFSQLDLSNFDTLKDMVLDKFRYVRSKIRKGVRYRNTEKLVSIIIYIFFKVRNISVNASELINASELTRKEFSDFFLQIRKYFPRYIERNRQKYILNRVFEVSEQFGLGMDYFHLARKILKKLWNGIKSTTDNAIAGLVCSISLLCSRNEDINVSAICNHLGIRMSTVQAQVKKKIITRFRVNGFISLIKSADLLVKVMEKLGLVDIEPSEPKEMCGDSVFDIVQIVVGTAQKVYNAIDDAFYYYFVIKGEDNAPVFLNLAVYNFSDSTKNCISSHGAANLDLDFLLYRYPMPTGRP